MNISRLKRRGNYEWELPAAGRMRVPGVIFASRELLEAMLPGLAQALRGGVNQRADAMLAITAERQRRQHGNQQWLN